MQQIFLYPSKIIELKLQNFAVNCNNNIKKKCELKDQETILIIIF